MTSIFRKTFFLWTAVVVILALVQVSGRLIIANLPELEDRINEQFSAVGVRVVGISGSWHYLNPSVEIDHLTYGGSEFHNVEMELDLVESLVRNRIIASRFRLSSAYVKALEREGEWQFYGSLGDVDFDLGAFLSHTDEYSITGTIEIYNSDSSAKIYADARAVNRGGRHRLDVVVSNEPECEACEIRLESDLTKPIFEMRKAKGFVKLSSSGIRITEKLASIFSLPSSILEVDAAWSSDGTEARARADLSVNAIDLPEAAMDVTLATAAIGVNDNYRGSLSVDVMTPHENIATTPIDYRVDGSGALTLWTTGVDIGEWSALFLSAFGSDKGIGLWVERVGATGIVRDPRLRVDSLGLVYEAKLEGLSVSGYKGVPELDEFRGWVRGDQNSFRIDLDGGPLRLGFPDQFGQSWDYNAASGSATFWFDPSYFGLRTHNLRISNGDARAVGGLSLSAPRSPMEKRLTIFGSVDGASFVEVKKYLPKILSSKLASWLRSSLVAGRLDDGIFVYHGDIRAHRDSRAPRMELSTRVTDGEISYHPDWPIVESVDARVEVTRRGTSVWVNQMVGIGNQIQDVRVWVPSPSKYVDIRLSTHIPTLRAIEFVRSTPIAAFMPYVTENWEGRGTIAVNADLRIPLQREFEHDDLKIEFDLVDSSLNAQDLGLNFENLNGSLSFRSPYALKADNFSGVLFGFPLDIVIASSEESVKLNFRGRSTLADVYRVIDIPDLGMGSGEFRFNAEFEGHPGTTDSPSLHVVTDAVGVALNLPAPLAKSRATPLVVETRIEFGDKYTSVEAVADIAECWLHIGGGEVLRGGIGIGGAMALRDHSKSGIVVTGGIDSWPIKPNLLLENPTLIPWHLNDFAVKRIDIDAFVLSNAILNGFVEGSHTAIDLISDELNGSARHDGSIWRLILQDLRIPSMESDGKSATSYGMLVNQLPAAEVSIEKLFIGQEDYGAWQFGLHRKDEGLHFADLVAHVRGLYLEADRDVVWIKELNRSRFSGRIAAKDLADVMFQWEQLPNLEGESMDIYADVDWPGSPLKFELGKLSGEMEVKLTDGRLLATKEKPVRVEASSVLSDAILNFSDVFPSGIGFDELSTKTKLEEGRVRFVEPLEIRGNETQITLSGIINFSESTLNNEITVTLPLSSSLPWYAVWIATVNPVSAAGVLLGGQVFREQIDQFSSATYKVGGTFEKPEVQLMDVITPKMDRPEMVMDRGDIEDNKRDEVLEGE